MKKITKITKIFLALLVVGAVSFSPYTANAASSQKEVNGTVTNASGIVSGAAVKVKSSVETVTTTSGADGKYKVNIMAQDGTALEVTATKDDFVGKVTRTVPPQKIIIIIIIIIKTTPVPEYGLIGGVAALATGAGVLLYARRKQQNFSL